MIALYFSLTDFQENMEAMKHNFFSAKLKNQKSLNAGGEFLASNQFAFAVVVASAGMEGDTQKDLVLTEARAMVVREYLVENFGFDASQLRTLGMGKQTEAKSDTGWGTVQIFVYPSGVEIPPTKGTQAPVPPPKSSRIHWFKLQLPLPRSRSRSDIGMFLPVRMSAQGSINKRGLPV